MSDSTTVTIDNPKKKTLVVGIAALCLCVVGALLVVGRGGGGGGTSFDAAARAASGATGRPSASPSRNGGSGGASFDEFRRCLEDQGVTPPDPGRGGQGQRPELSDSLRRAFESCRRYLPARPPGGGFGGPGDGETPDDSSF